MRRGEEITGKQQELSPLLVTLVCHHHLVCPATKFKNTWTTNEQGFYPTKPEISQGDASEAARGKLWKVGGYGKTVLKCSPDLKNAQGWPKSEAT